jgi:hypothetical protein
MSLNWGLKQEILCKAIKTHYNKSLKEKTLSLMRLPDMKYKLILPFNLYLCINSPFFIRLDYELYVSAILETLLYKNSLSKFH